MPRPPRASGPRGLRRGPPVPEVFRQPLPWGRGPRLCLCYPNTYPLGMANLGFQCCLEQLSAFPVAVDRAFLESTEGHAGRRSGGPRPKSLDHEFPLDRFDYLFFSVSFEPDYVGLVELLLRAGLEPLAERRSRGAPLIVVGGLPVTLNPEPLALIADLIGVGEAEVLLPSLLGLVLDGLPRDDFLVKAASLPGWYVPAVRDAQTDALPVVRQHVSRLDRPVRPMILGQGVAFGAHVDLEVSRGCRWRCRFCAAGQVVTPYREVSVENLAPDLDWAVEKRGCVGLVGTDVSDHGQLLALAEAVWSRGGELALPSLRVEALARPGGPAEQIVRARPPRTLTLAVEAASRALRRALHKDLDDEALVRAAALAADAGVMQLRLYFLVGIPGERWDEVEAIVPLCEQLGRLGPPGPLTLSVTGLVPKAGTPLQWLAAPDRAYLRRARAMLRERLPVGTVQLRFESPDHCRWQALLSLGDRGIAAHLVVAAREGWRVALARAEAQEPLLQGVARSPGDPLPWAFVGHSASPEHLGLEWQRCLDRR